jgi:hypothetical protein
VADWSRLNISKSLRCPTVNHLRSQNFDGLNLPTGSSLDFLSCTPCGTYDCYFIASKACSVDTISNATFLLYGTDCLPNNILCNIRGEFPHACPSKFLNQPATRDIIFPQLALDGNWAIMASICKTRGTHSMKKIQSVVWLSAMCG